MDGSLQDYANAVRDAGMRIESIQEPRPPNDNRWRQWINVPLFMNVSAVKV